MPLYEYECKDGHRFEARVRLDMSDEPSRCPVVTDPADPKALCWGSVERVFPLPARSFPGADSWRK